MPRRRKRKANRRPAKRTRSRRNAPARTPSNKAVQWAAFKALQRRVDHAWTKLKSDVKRKAGAKTILRDRNQLLLLLGECNYMTRE